MERGSVVAIMLPNRVELLVAMVAAWRLGAAATPMNPTFTATEAAHQLSDSAAVVLVTDGDTATGGLTVLPVDDLRTRERGRRAARAAHRPKPTWRCSSTPAAPPGGPRA